MISNDTTPVKRISPGDLRDILFAHFGKPTACGDLAAAIYKFWGDPNDATWPDLSDEDIACALGYLADGFNAIAERLTVEREAREAGR